MSCRPTAACIPGLRRFAAGAACALAAFAARSASAEIDVEVGSGDRITATLSPATEIETYRFRVPREAVVSIRAKAARKGPELVVAFFDPMDAGIQSADGRAPSITGYRAAVSGLFAVTVRSKDGVAAGDYSLAITWKSRTSFPIAAALAPGGELSVPFAADAAAKATFAVQAKGGPPKAVPALVDLTDPASVATPLGSKSLVLPLSGEYVLRLRDAGAAGGDVKGAVKIRPARRAARKLNLTAKAIGSGGAAGGAAYAELVGAAGGVVVFPADVGQGEPGAELVGSAVAFPPGALPASTPIFIATASPIEKTGLAGAGPTVQFGPEGLRFSQKALVTIPLDPQFAADPGSVRIYTRDAKGRLTLVDPDVPPGYTFGAGTVTFPASHFSEFRAFSTAPPAGARIALVATLLGLQDVCIGNDPSAGTTRNRYYAAQGAQRRVAAIQETSGVPGFTAVTWAGGGTSSVDGTDRLQFAFPAAVQSVTTVADGTLFVATATQIFRIATTGAVTAVAGTGAQGDTGDGSAATLATFTSIQDILVAADGTIFVADPGFGAHRIRVIGGVDGIVRAYAGASSQSGGLGADGGNLATTSFFGPRGLAFAPAGGLYVTDNTRIRHIDPLASPPVNVTVAGDPNGVVGSTGDGGPPRSALFTATQGVATFLPESGGAPDAIVVTSADATLRLIDFTTNTVTLLAGTAGQMGYLGDDVPAPSLLLGPLGIATEQGHIVFVDSGRVRQHREQ